MIPKKHRSIETLKSRYGAMFISPWILGMLVFFVYPILNSVYLGFADLSIDIDGIVTEFVGVKNYYTILVTDPKYLDMVIEAVKDMLISMPFILIVSIVLALLLNGQYKGRIFFRGLYFLPVIFASGPVLSLFLQAGNSKATTTALSEEANFGMIDFTTILVGLNLPSSIENYLSLILSEIFMLVWLSGIQTILLIAGLQSIPDLHYEVAKVEGATAWETFWFVTFPQLIRTILLVMIFTIVELCGSSTNNVVSSAYSSFNNLKYGEGSAMLWFYYLFVGILIAIVFALYKNLFVKKWGETS